MSRRAAPGGGAADPSGVTGKVAVRLPLDAGPTLDPFALAGPTGIVFQTADRLVVGLGGALTLPLPDGLTGEGDTARVADALAAIECDEQFDPATSGVMAFATLPFDRSASGTLVVPEIVYGIESSGAEWVTVVADDAHHLPSGSAGVRAWLQGLSTGSGAPSAVTEPGAEPQADVPDPVIIPRLSDASFEEMVGEAVRAIESRDVAKVVVSRQVDVQMGEAIDVAALLRRWHQLEPACSVFSMPTPEGQLVGASPELLVERTGRHVHSRPLAGTTGRSGGADGTDGTDGVLPRELLSSVKDSAEHRMVVEAIGDALGPLCADLDVPDQPDLVHLHTITHLGTSVSGTLSRRPDGSVPTALELVALLHPTPAVGGVPRDRALAVISRLEREARGHYAGPVGYVDARGDGCWMLGIRAVTVDGPSARLAAGVGVVEGSDPRTERVEAVLKLTAAFDALAPGFPFSTSGRPALRAPTVPPTPSDAYEAHEAHEAVG